MIGKRFGKLVIVELYGKKGNNRKKHYKCKCDCGNETIVCIDNLRSGHTQSCGCLKNGPSKRRVDLTGNRFGKLVAIAFSKSNGKGTTLWRCKCDCGNEIEVSYNNLKSGNTKSCGCWHEKHGDVGSRLYKCWQDMKARCEYKKDTNYHNYGGRGIIVCDEWRNSYLNFKAWALKNGYAEKLTIDRIDVNGNYEPCNCRWVGFDVQANNTRANIYVEYNGEKMTLRQFARKYTEPMGVSYKALWHRYSVAKWSLEKCANTPLMNQ